MSAPRAAWLGWIEGVRQRLRKQGEIQASLVVDLLSESFVVPALGLEAPLAPEAHVVRVIAELGAFPPPWGAS